jgi:hypothetical protein
MLGTNTLSPAQGCNSKHMHRSLLKVHAAGQYKMLHSCTVLLKAHHPAKAEPQLIVTVLAPRPKSH